MSLKLKLVSLFDTVAGTWSAPIGFHSEAQALRSFEDMVAAREGDVGKHPGDFILFCVGTFESQTGVLTGYGEAEVIVHGSSLTHGGE